MKIFKRIMSVIMVIVLVALFIAVFVLGISGSDYFPVALLLCVIVPVLFYGMSLMTKVLSEKGKEMEQEVLKSQEQEESASNNVEKEDNI